MRKITFWLFCFIVFSTSLCSQELSELRLSNKGKLLPEELIDKNIKDANGEVCAGLMMISDMDGLTYTSYNQIVKINKLPGKDLLFLSEDERVVEVYKTGYKPLKIILNEHGIRLNKGKVWMIEITGDKKTDLIPVNIIVDQSDVKIFIDSLERGISATHLLQAGEHHLRLEKDGFRPIDTTIRVSTSSTLFSYKMKEIDLIVVQIKSVPVGARIIFDNSEKGETDRGLFLLPGRHKLRLTKSGYMDVEQTIDVTDLTRNEFSFNLTKNEGTLKIAVVPADANILINKEDYSGRGEIPLTQGKYKLEISKPGYGSLTETIEIKLGETVTKTYTLRERTGGLQFSIIPLEAKMRLICDGEVKYSWQGLKVFKDILVGEYKLECRLSGYKTVKRPIIIEEGKTKTEEVQLEKLKSGEKEEDTLEVIKSVIAVKKVITGNEMIKSLKLSKNGSSYQVSFDFPGDKEEEYNIELYLMDENKKDFSVKLTKVNGSVGEGKFAGTNRSIIWMSGEEFEENIDSRSLYLFIKAEKISGGIPWYYYAGAAVIGGVTAILVTKKSPDSSTSGSSPAITIVPVRPSGN